MADAAVIHYDQARGTVELAENADQLVRFLPYRRTSDRLYRTSRPPSPLNLQRFVRINYRFINLVESRSASDSVGLPVPVDEVGVGELGEMVVIKFDAIDIVRRGELLTDPRIGSFEFNEDVPPLVLAKLLEELVER